MSAVTQLSGTHTNSCAILGLRMRIMPRAPAPQESDIYVAIIYSTRRVECACPCVDCGAIFTLLLSAHMITFYLLLQLDC